MLFLRGAPGAVMGHTFFFLGRRSVSRRWLLGEVDDDTQQVAKGPSIGQYPRGDTREDEREASVVWEGNQSSVLGELSLDKQRLVREACPCGELAGLT